MRRQNCFYTEYFFFKDFNKARAALAKGVRTKKTQLHLGAERKSWGAAAISWAGGDNRDSGAENGRIFLQIFDAFWMSLL